MPWAPSTRVLPWRRDRLAGPLSDLRFGFVLPNNWGVEDVADVVDLAVEAEELGFDSVWVNHHILNVGYVSDRLGSLPYYDALTILTWVASRTERVRLGTSVLVIPYLHPMVLAKQIATLDVLSGGRLVLGIGVGGLPEENAALGIDYASRGSYADESIGVMRALWSHGDASYEGRHFSFERLTASPKPLQQPHPPLLIGGNSRPALHRAARLGNGWHPDRTSPEETIARLVYLDEELERVGRTRDEMAIALRADGDVLTSDQVEAYGAAGVHEIVVSLATGDVARIRTKLRDLARMLLG